MDGHAGARLVQRARDFGADAPRRAGDQDDRGDVDDIHYFNSIPASTRAAAAKPKLAVIATEEP